MGNKKSICLQKEEEDIQTNKEMNHTLKSKQNDSIKSKQNEILLSFERDDFQQSLDEIQDELMISIDMSEREGDNMNILVDRCKELTKRVRQLSIKSQLEVKQQLPTQQMIEVLQQFSNVNALNSLCLRLEFDQLPFHYFNIIAQCVYTLSLLTNLHIRLNNSISYPQCNYLSAYSHLLNNKSQLKHLFLLISFKNTFLNRQEFYEFLDAFHSMKSLECLSLCIENSTYGDLVIDVIYSVIAHPHLNKINIDVCQFVYSDDELSHLTQPHLKYHNNILSLSSSTLQILNITKLKCHHAHILFTLLSHLPQIEELSVQFVNSGKNQQSEMKRLQEFSSQKKFLSKLMIELYNNEGSEVLSNILSYLGHFIADQFQCLFPLDQIHRVSQLLAKHENKVSLLSVVWNQVKIYNNDRNIIPIIGDYISSKDSTILSYLLYQRSILQFMICNPNFVFLDLYIQ